jgi:hypothetical protein
MKPRELTLLVIGLLLMAGTAGALVALKANQRLGKPGVKASPIAESQRMRIELPLQVAGYEAKERDDEEVRKALESLPSDTSMVQAVYREVPDGAEIQTFVVMMGTDRTSIHKPQFCLTGAGWNIDDKRSERAVVRIEQPQPVDLPVMKLITSRKVEVNGQAMDYSGVFVYWFVADNAVTEDHWTRVSWMARHLLTTGELQRWAYIAYFAPCPPGREEETFERITRLINATVPQYQLAWP